MNVEPLKEYLGVGRLVKTDKPGLWTVIDADRRWGKLHLCVDRGDEGGDWEIVAMGGDIGEVEWV